MANPINCSPQHFAFAYLPCHHADIIAFSSHFTDSLTEIHYKDSCIRINVITLLCPTNP